jgi:ATP-dependent Clp protease ATP-binding subunit ClpA
MFERFTDRARRVVVLGQEEAQELGHDYIGTEHILLGLVREGDGVAAQVLVQLGANLNTVRTQVVKVLQESPDPLDVPGESSAPEERPHPAASGHLGQQVRVVGSRIQLESLGARVDEMISRLGVIVERLASMEERLASIEGHLAEGKRPAARAPRKPAAPRRPKQPPAEPPTSADEPPASGGA